MKALPRAERLTRARTFLSLTSTYVLGGGGRDPHAPTPFTWHNGERGADCIGFAMWCLGLDRFQPKEFRYYAGWMNTDSILDDAHTGCAGGHWEVVNRPVPGDLVIYHSLRRAGRMTRMGHVGVITAVPAEWQPRNICSEADWFDQMKRVTVVDCAGALARRLRKRAIGERPATIWAKDGNFVALREAA